MNTNGGELWTLTLSEEQRSALLEATQLSVETGAVLLCAAHQYGRTGRLILREIAWVPDARYLERSADRLVISSEGYMPSLSRAEARGWVAIWFHTHPGIHGALAHSSLDERVDAELASVFQLRTDSDLYGSLIATSRDGSLEFIGFVEYSDGRRASIEKTVTLGDALLVQPTHSTGSQVSISPEFSRNVAAFGGAIQAALGLLEVAVVGCGGTGSATAEQLVRLGVRRLTLIDPDKLDVSNITRVYGSTPDDVDTAKVLVLGRHLMRIAPDLRLDLVEGSVTSQGVARQLATCDVLFGCTDDNAGRIVLSRMAAYLRQLVIDMGVLISSADSGQIQGIDGRVTILKPGTACLICRGRIDLQRANAESLSAVEHRRLAGEGYVPALGGIQPAVVAYTTMVAAQSIAELIELLVGYGPSPRPSEVLLRFHDREISTNRVEPNPRHFCAAHSAHDDTPFLGKVWTA